MNDRAENQRKKRKVSFVPVLLLGMLLFGGCAPREQPPLPSDLAEPVALAIATDLHYLSPELTDHGPYFQRLIQNGDGKAMDRVEEITDAFVAQVVADRPDALILSGDLTFNGARMSHTALAEKLRQVTDAGVPVFVLPGNHDLENPMAASFQGDGYTLTESIGPQEFENIYRSFGFETALSRDKTSLSYMAEVTPALWLLMLDVNTPDAPGILTESILSWVEEQLREARQLGVRVVAVSHQNLLPHSSLFTAGYIIEGNNRLLELYEGYGVLCNLSGHMHIQHIAQSEQGLPEIAASSLLVSPNQYGVLKLEGEKAVYRAVPLSLEFAEEVRAFFWGTGFRQASAVFGGQPEAAEMAAYFAEVNTAYFSGRMDTIQRDEELMGRWGEQETFLSAYLKSILEEVGRDHTGYDFDL